MDTPRLHPLLILTAVSLTAFSATGIGVLTGVISSPRSAQEAPEQPLPALRPAARPVEAILPKAVEPVAEQPVPVVREPAPQPRVQRPAVRPPVRAAAPAPRAEPVVFREFDEPAPVAQAPQPAPLPPVAAQPPAPAGITGVVQSVREVALPGEAKGVGAITGGLLGGLLASQVGHGDGRKLLTVLGMAGGALAGNRIEKDAAAGKRWEIRVRLDDGTTQTLSSDVAPFWNAGDRVRFLDGRLQPA